LRNCPGYRFPLYGMVHIAVQAGTNRLYIVNRLFL
jgi:hypothetical protein